MLCSPEFQLQEQRSSPKTGQHCGRAMWDAGASLLNKKHVHVLKSAVWQHQYVAAICLHDQEIVISRMDQKTGMHIYMILP